jgi:catechol 2,3-dioxygenase-like lactoylglutathione lyase family enzyme
MGIHGTHGITVSVYDLDLSADFMTQGWSGRHTQEEGDHARFEVGQGGSGAIVDFVAEPGLGQAGWMYGEGIVHHTAFQVANFVVQDGVKDGLVGLGFTDVSDRKDRGYFDSVYVRTPGGAMFEATVSKSTASSSTSRTKSWARTSKSLLSSLIAGNIFCPTSSRCSTPEEQLVVRESQARKAPSKP